MTAIVRLSLPGDYPASFSDEIRFSARRVWQRRCIRPALVDYAVRTFGRIEVPCGLMTKEMNRDQRPDRALRGGHTWWMIA